MLTWNTTDPYIGMVTVRFSSTDGLLNCFAIFSSLRGGRDNTACQAVVCEWVTDPDPSWLLSVPPYHTYV